MRYWEQISFDYAWVLWFLIPYMIIAILAFYFVKPKHSISINSVLPAKVRKTPYQWLAFFNRWLPWLAGIGLIIALAGPYHSLVKEEQTGEGIDIFMAMDISGSMLARDFEPNRLEVAKNVATSFVAQRPFDQIGLVAFAGEAYTLSPLTTDQNILQQFIRELKVGQLEDGTAIGMGLATAINRLDSSNSASRIIILLTDGENTTGYIDPTTAMEIAVNKGIRVYTIGVGTKGEAPMPYARRNNQYLYRMSKVNMDEELLKEIATKTGGQYFRAQSADELKRIYDEIDALEKSEIQIEVFQQKSPAFAPFIILAGISILLYLLLDHLIIKKWP